MPESFVFTRLYVPRPFDAATGEVLLTRLLGSDVPRPLAFEVTVSTEGVSAAFGSAPTAVHRLTRLLGGLLPGLRFGPVTRPDVAAVSRVSARPGGLPLSAVDPEQIVAALYQAFAARRKDEVIGLQVILGRAHRPQLLTATPLDPLQPLGSKLLDGIRPAPTDTRKRLHAHAADARVDVTLRIGVTAPGQRRHARMWEVFGALQPLQSPGVRLSLLHDTASRWRAGQPGPGSKLRLSPKELVPLLCWPIGERDYPGVPGVHPRLLPVPEIVSRTDSVFAVGTAPGPGRPIGIDPQSRLQHMVVIGPTGSGKSTLLEHLILSDITAGRACCVIEPKSQLIDRILKIAPAEAIGQIVVLDATDEEAPVGFNPLDAGDRDPDIVVDGILAALGAVFHDGWGPRTEYLVQGALLSLARAGQRRAEPYTLIDLPRLLTDTAFRRPIVGAVQDDPTLAAFWADFETMSPGQRAAAIASPLNKLRKIVLRKPLVRVLGQSQPRFRLRDIFREHKTVLVPLNDALLGAGASKLLGSLIVAELFLATTERAREKNPMKRPGMIIIDEVQNYLHLPTPIDDAMSVFRSYGVGLHVAHQYRKQLPDAMREGFDTNARNKICFPLGAKDAGDMARQAPLLTADDFQTLPLRNIYTHLLAGGVPTQWCSARALPPAPKQKNARRIREASRELFGALPQAQTTAVPSEAAEDAPTTETPPARRSHQKARQA